jgi:hypothetical protein
MNMHNKGTAKFGTAKGVLLSVGGLAWWTGGCAPTTHQDAFTRNGAETLLPKLTTVISGPAGSLLANGSGFHANFTITLGDRSQGPLTLSGEVFERGGKLDFVTVVGNHKSRGSGGFNVGWDTAMHQGYVSSEALQAYAPLSGSFGATNSQTQVLPGTAERVEGHPVDQANMTFQAGDGQTIALQLMRASDLGNLPLKITSVSGPQSFTLSLSNIEAAAPPEEVFLPPDGFTKYASEEVLLDELAERQHNVFSPDEIENMGQPGTGTHRVNNEH